MSIGIKKPPHPITVGLLAAFFMSMYSS